MIHRHLNHQNYTLAAIDDIISRGLWVDWVDMHKEILSNVLLLDKVEKICKNYISDPYQQRYHFWYNYVQKSRKNT
jgi:hypothetical protein